MKELFRIEDTPLGADSEENIVLLVDDSLSKVSAIEYRYDIDWDDEDNRFENIEYVRPLFAECACDGEVCKALAELLEELLDEKTTTEQNVLLDLSMQLNNLPELDSGLQNLINEKETLNFVELKEVVKNIQNSLFDVVEWTATSTSKSGKTVYASDTQGHKLPQKEKSFENSFWLKDENGTFNLNIAFRSLTYAINNFNDLEKDIDFVLKEVLNAKRSDYYFVTDEITGMGTLINKFFNFYRYCSFDTPSDYLIYTILCCYVYRRHQKTLEKINDAMEVIKSKYAVLNRLHTGIAHVKFGERKE